MLSDEMKEELHQQASKVVAQYEAIHSGVLNEELAQEKSGKWNKLFKSTSEKAAAQESENER